MRTCGEHCAYADQREEPVTLVSACSRARDSMRTFMRRALSEYRYQALNQPRAHPPVAANDALSSSLLEKYYRMQAFALPPTVQHAYRPLSADEETQEFLNSCRPNWCKSVLAVMLRWVFSVTDTNALLRRGQMFVVSRQHIRELLDGMMTRDGVSAGAAVAETGTNSSSRSHAPLRLLDVGAGDGGVTANLAALFDHVTVTEVSRPMASRLRERGYEVVVTPYLSREAFPTDHSYDVVSIFNVLDRCDHPLDLLKGAIRLLKPGGRLVLAVVLPFSEFVEEGTKRRSVIAPLPMKDARCGDSASFEQSLSALITRVIIPLGLQCERIAKLPYLCRGDSARPYYVLSDAILICRVREEGIGGVAASGVVDMREASEAAFQASLLSAGGPLSQASTVKALRIGGGVGLTDPPTVMKIDDYSFP